jgi:pimeloyl-ACP methyl ester carboxylesterase
MEAATREQTARVNGIEIVYEEFGDPANETLLLIMGLGVQMLGWDERFCQLLVERGFHVVRFDNRDVGRSTKIDGGATPDVGAAMLGDASSASYALEDMADDTVRLLDHLGIHAAHLVGASLGGMIAQTVAVRHPERVLSLTSVMSTTGGQAVGQPHPEAIPALLTPPPADREGYAESTVAAFRVIGTKGVDGSDEFVRERALRSFDRGYFPEGVARQLLGVIASGDRTAALANVEAPTLVIHGTADPLIDVSGGQATAAAIPGARLELIEGMGHDLPRPLWPRFIDLIVENTERGRAGATANDSSAPTS